MNDPILQEIYEVRRKHWIEAGGTREGLRAYHERFAREFREKGPDVMLRERLEARKREREAAAAAALAEGAMMVCEQGAGYGAEGEQTTGAGPRTPMGEKKDLAREGTEGDAE